MSSSSRQFCLQFATLFLTPLALAQDLGDSIESDGVRIFEPTYYDEFDPVTAMELVFRTPGFRPEETSGGRGLAGVRSNLLINGERPPPKGQSAFQQLRELPVRGVEQIELIDVGARQDIDMQGFSQVVNVVTVADAPAYYEVITDFRKSGTGDVRHDNERETGIEATGSFSLREHKFTLRADAEDRSNRSPAGFVAIDPANPQQRISSLTRSERNDHGFELSSIFTLPQDSTVTFSGQFSAEEFSSSPLSILEDPDAPDTVDESFAREEEDQDLSTEYRRPFGAGGSIMLAFVDAGSTDRSESSLIDAGETRASVEDRESGETAARLLLTQSPTDRLTVRTTATSAFNFFDGNFRIFENGTEVPIDGSDSRVEEDRHSLESSVDWNLSDRWTLRGSLGAESYEINSGDNSSGVQTDPTGSVSVSYRPQERTTLSFESTRDIGQLSFGQFLASSNLSSEILTAGASELEPQRSWTHQVIYDRRFGDVGVLRFELSREEVDNPVRTVALSDSITVSQNTSPRTIDRFRTELEYPFEQFGREDLILRLNTVLAQSDTVDPVTAETRVVSGVAPRFWSLELRRDPGDGPLSWGMSVSRRIDGERFSVRQIRESSSSHDWSAYVEWEPIDGLKLRTNLDGPRWDIRRSSFFDAVREPGLQPSFFATTVSRVDRSASFSVEWRRREHLEIRASLSTRPKVLTEESLIPFGATEGTLQTTETARTPRATLRFRFYR